MERNLPERWSVPEHRVINFPPMICGMPHATFAAVTCSLVMAGLAFGQVLLALATAAALFPLGKLITARDPLGWQAVFANLRVKRVYWP